jgi:hypothetical protein
VTDLRLPHYVAALDPDRFVRKPHIKKRVEE